MRDEVRPSVTGITAEAGDRRYGIGPTHGSHFLPLARVAEEIESDRRCVVA